MTYRQQYDHIVQQLSSIYPKGETMAIADLVAEHYLGKNRLAIMLDANKPVDTNTSVAIDQSIVALLQHQPVQYVLKEAWFRDLKLYVNENVLIPRPETEELVEWIIHDTSPNQLVSIMDIGTGSGCIPVSLKKVLPSATITAIDKSEDALAVAQKNSDHHQTTIQFTQLDFLDKNARAALGRYDIIVSNPPYIPQQESAQMDQNVLAYEPRLALFVPDEDPLLFYKAIADFANTHLTRHGSIYLECHYGHSIDVQALFEANGFTTILKKDISGNDRMVKAWR